MSSIDWKEAPTTIGEPEKLEAFQRLLPELTEDRDLGGYRVEVRCKGHGNPQEWLATVVEWLNLQLPFDASVTLQKVPTSYYMRVVKEQVQAFETLLKDRDNIRLCKTHPFVRKYKKAARS